MLNLPFFAPANAHSSFSILLPLARSTSAKSIREQLRPVLDARIKTAPTSSPKITNLRRRLLRLSRYSSFFILLYKIMLDVVGQYNGVVRVYIYNNRHIKDKRIMKNSERRAVAATVLALSRASVETLVTYIRVK